MNKFILIILFIGSISLSYGQTLSDKQRVIQVSIDLDELNQYYQADQVGGRKPLIILNNGIVPSNLNLTKFNEPVKFMSREDVFSYNRNAFLDFEKFNISPTQAHIIFYYKIEDLKVELTFEKVGEEWSITKKELIKS